MQGGGKLRRRSEPTEGGVLRSLGFGPGTVLMTDPKLLVDGRFLAGLLFELEAEIGVQETRSALFQIGLSHGYREARRLIEGDFVAEGERLGGSPCETTSLLMRLEPSIPSHPGAGHRIDGCWPEGHEARARLSRLGRASEPACYLSAGYTSGWLSGIHDADLIAVEVECAAAGAPHCTFRALEAEEWRARDPGRLQVAQPLGLEQLRATAELAAGGDARGPSDLPQEASFDPNLHAVHIWGPVMILPFADVDEALGTVEMLGREPGTGDVQVVVVDLRGRPIDDGMDAAGLERLVETIEGWSAEVILTGVSPLSDTVISGLEVARLLVRKDLPNAIASAFQIAEAQRHLA